MLQVILGVIRCISDFLQLCVSKTAGLRAKHTHKSLCYPAVCGHCLPSCQAERQAPGLLVVSVKSEIGNKQHTNSDNNRTQSGPAIYWLITVFETKPCSRGFVFAISPGLVNYLGTRHELCLRVLFFLRFKNVANFANYIPDKHLP